MSEDLIGLSIKEELICPPPPSKADLFGIVDNIKSEYEEQTEKMMKQSKETQVNNLNTYRKDISCKLVGKDGVGPTKENSSKKTKTGKDEN